MKYILTFFFLSLCLFAHAQCEWAENKTDDFTKAKVRETYPVKINTGFGDGMSCIIRQVDSSYYFRFTYSTLGAVAMVVGKGADLMLKLDNDSVVTLKSIDTQPADIRYTSSGNMTALVAKYYLLKSDMLILKSHRVTKVRVYLTDSYLEKDIKEKNQGNIRNAVNCILSNG